MCREGTDAIPFSRIHSASNTILESVHIKDEVESIVLKHLRLKKCPLACLQPVYDLPNKIQRELSALIIGPRDHSVLDKVCLLRYNTLAISGGSGCARPAAAQLNMNISTGELSLRWREWNGMETRRYLAVRRCPRLL